MRHKLLGHTSSIFIIDIINTLRSVDGTMPFAFVCFERTANRKVLW